MECFNLEAVELLLSGHLRDERSFSLTEVVAYRGKNLGVCMGIEKI